MKIVMMKKKKAPSEKSKPAAAKPKYQRNKSAKDSSEKSGMAAPKKIKLLFTIVNRQKTDFFVDVLQEFEVNMQLTLAASGTASSETLSLLGLTDSEKSVIISVIRDDKAPLALKGLDEKFNTIKNGKGIAYTIPVSSTIGVAIYQFLANLPTNKRS
jgi:hypothetical protein